MHEIFADSPESRAWLDGLASVSEAEKNRISIPEEETWRSWLEYVEIPKEDLADVIATTPTPQTDPVLYDILQRGAAQLVGAMGEIDIDFRFATLRDFNDPRYRYFYVQLLAACLPFVRAYHQSLGIPDSITQATVADLGRNVRVHRKREGVGGLGVMWWLMLHFRGVIFQLGRLQFEMQHAGSEIAASMREHGIEAREPTNALSIHIPDFMGPMDHHACSESIARAATFFPSYFPNWPVHHGYCNSWLLDPQLKTILRPTSNIILFQNRFTLADESWEANETVMQFVFGRHLRDIDTINPQSSLECGVVEHLKNGKDWKARVGWLTLSSVSDSEPKVEEIWSERPKS